VTFIEHVTSIDSCLYIDINSRDVLAREITCIEVVPLMYSHLGSDSI
jgi:hypothetical protein